MDLKTLQNLEKKTFIIDEIPYMVIHPVKSLLRSTTLYEILTRGDYLCLNLSTGYFTVLKQADVIEAQLQMKSEIDSISREIKRRNLKALEALKKEFQEKLDQLNLNF